VKSNLVKLNFIAAIGSTQFQAVVATVFLLAKGFSLGQLMLLGSIYAIGTILSEVPTGIFSDRIGRKNSLITYLAISIPITVIVIVSNSLPLIAIMYFLFGIAASFNSGNDTAILYDTLKELDREDEFKKINGKQKWFSSWGGAIGGIAGGLIASLGLAYAWWVWVLALVFMLVIALTLEEPTIHSDSALNTSPLIHFKQSLKYTFRGDVSYFILYYVLIWLFFWMGYSLWQPYLQLSRLPVIYFGFVYAGASLIGGLASKQTHIIEKRIGTQVTLLIIPIILALAFILESRIILTFSFIFIGVHALASGVFRPAIDDYINSRVPSHSRATVLSTQNMLSSIAFMIASPLIGYFVDLYSLPVTLLLMAALLIALALIFNIVYQNKRGAINKTATAIS